jgi:hypothetical protein
MGHTLLVASTTRRLGDFALLLGFAGAMVIAWAKGAWLAAREGADDRHRERVRTMVGALLIAAAFLLLFVVRVFLNQ